MAAASARSALPILASAGAVAAAGIRAADALKATSRGEYIEGDCAYQQWCCVGWKPDETCGGRDGHDSGGRPLRTLVPSLVLSMPPLAMAGARAVYGQEDIWSRSNKNNDSKRTDPVVETRDRHRPSPSTRIWTPPTPTRAHGVPPTPRRPVVSKASPQHSPPAPPQLFDALRLSGGVELAHDSLRRLQARALRFEFHPPLREAPILGEQRRQVGVGERPIQRLFYPRVTLLQHLVADDHRHTVDKSSEGDRPKRVKCFLDLVRRLGALQIADGPRPLDGITLTLRRLPRPPAGGPAPLRTGYSPDRPAPPPPPPSASRAPGSWKRCARPSSAQPGATRQQRPRGSP